MQAKEDFEIAIEQLETMQNKQAKLNNLVPSQFYTQYKKQINELTLDRAKAEERLAEHNIRFCLNKYQGFKYEIRQALLNYHILKMHIRLIHFQMDIYILNQEINNPILDLQNKQCGKFGQVYLIGYLNQNIAIKSVQIKAQNFAATFQRLLKQVCIFKICSIIGCSVKYEKYLGFDLIVYKDCMQFAMKQGKQEKKKKQMQLLLNLKCQMALMHSFNIVHCDIKPQNIIFCPSQQKFVLIDFGLAEVIEEVCGFKSKTCYKGTPQFSSHEMVSIMISRSLQYIDLYFNDLFSLKNSIQSKFQENQSQRVLPSQSIKNALNFLPISANCQGPQTIIKQQPSQQIIDSVLSQYLTYEFKFYYLFHNTAKLNDILNYNDHFLVRRSSKELLIFIKGTFHKLFIPEIFYQHFGCSQVTDEYKRVQNLMKLSSEMIISSSVTNEESIYSSQFFKKYFEIGIKSKYISNKSVHFDIIFDYFFRNTLQKMIHLGSQEVMFDILLQCLRFDRTNLSFEKKTKLAALSNSFFSLNHKQSIKDIKFAFQRIANSIFKNELIKWKFYKGFDVFYQMIILDINIDEHLLTEFISKIKNKYNKMEDKFILAMELRNLSALISIKCTSSLKRYHFTVRSSLKTQETKLFQQILNRMAENQLQISLCILSKSALENRLLGKEKEKFILSSIIQLENSRLIDLIKNIIATNRIISLFNYRYEEDILSCIKITLKQQSQNQNMLRILTFTTQFFPLFLHSQQLRQLQESIKTMFDCQQIYKTFKIQYNFFLYNRNDTNQQLLTKYLLELLQNYPILKQMKSIDRKIINQIYFLILKLKNNLKFQKKQQQIIQQVYEKYIRQNYFQVGSFKFLNILVCDLEIQFLSILPNYYEGYICLKLAYLKQKLKIAYQVYLDDKCPQKMRIYQQLQYIYLSFRQYQIKLQNNNQEYLNNLLSLSEITSQLFGQFVAIQKNCSTIFQLLIIMQKKQQAFNYIDQVGNFISKNGKFGFYLDPVQYNLLEQILSIHLERKQFHKIYQMITNLIEWVADNYLPAYLDTLMFDLRVLFSKDRSIFQYSHLQQNIQSFKQKLAKNPYYTVLLIYSISLEELQSNRIKILKLIALRLNYLVAFPKKHLLVQYYAHMISSQTISLRNQAYLIKFSRNFKKRQLKELLRSKMIKCQQIIVKKNSFYRLNNNSWKKLINNAKQALI